MNEPIKLNIHLTIDDRALQFCRKVNAKIRDIAGSVIVFSDDSPMLPHITLLMGEMNSVNQLDDLVAFAENIARNYSPLTLYFGAPYVETYKNNYVFVDAEQNAALMRLRQDFAQGVQGVYLTSSDTYSDTPHLTLGNIDATKRSLVDDYLKSVQSISEIGCENLEISHVGPKGTCIDSIFVARLSGECMQGASIDKESH